MKWKKQSERTTVGSYYKVPGGRLTRKKFKTKPQEGIREGDHEKLY